MRILHFADLHIGVENYSVPSPETGLPSRLEDALKALDEVVDFALQGEVDLVLFCGDAYKSRNPEQTHQREFASRIARLLRAGIPVFLLVGNHDLPNAVNRATALDIFETLRISDKLVVGTQLATYALETRQGPVQVVALPWIRRSEFLAREDLKGLPLHLLNERIQDTLARQVSDQVASLQGTIPALLAGHVSVLGADLGSERAMTVGRDHLIRASSLTYPKLDYIALGHVHKHQRLSTNPPVVYSGSLQRIDFGEEGQQKGFCVIELDITRLAGMRLREVRFHPVRARSFLTISIDLPPGEENPTQAVLQGIGRYHVQDAIVRLQLQLQPYQAALLQEHQVRRALSGAHYLASITKEVRDAGTGRRRGEYIGSMSPADALRRYLEARDLPAERVQLLVRRGKELVANLAQEKAGKS